MHPDAQRWNEKYRRARGPRHFRPEPRLEGVADLLGAPGNALEIACGAGGSALWLAAQGWQVCGVDVSVEALRIARQEAQRRHLTLQAVVADSGALPFIDDGSLRLAVVVRYLDRNLFAWLQRALGPGGQVFCCTFNEGHLQAHPRFNADYVLAPGELDRTFASFERQAGEDGDDVSWILARKPA